MITAAGSLMLIELEYGSTGIQHERANDLDMLLFCESFKRSLSRCDD